MVVVGLGNPGKEYLFSRHNVGFMLLDRLTKKLGLEFKLKGKNLVAKGELILVKPQTYMNSSGQALQDFKNDELVVVYDDIELPLGVMKIKLNASSTHNGVRSVKEIVPNFIHFRIGIGKQIPVREFVLEKFSKEELHILDKVLDKAMDALLKLPLGLDIVINQFNGSVI